ncbi:MAG: BBP7 family outer membrane beta-barrel protein, partial [Planctomycetes bacterium]|nr:BBP7 family outer membrane beta-barrel protein [Planctomycetota bacterium]
MKRNEAKFTLATVFLALTGIVVSAAQGADGYSHAPNPAGFTSAAGDYANYIGDGSQRPNATAAPGFASYLDDGVQPASAALAADGSGAFDVDMDDSCYGSYGSICSSRLWFSVDYLMLWTKGRALPPLVTTGVPGEDGVLGLASTSILYGGKDIGEDFRSTGRFSLGFWLDECERLGLGARFLISETDDLNFGRGSNPNGSPVLARPFYNSDPIADTQDSLIISRPGIRRGEITAMSDNDLMSLDAYFRVLLYQCGNRRLDLLAGYQFSRIDDNLNIKHRMVQLAGDFPPGTQFAFHDAFDVQNSFNGGVLGLQGEYTRGGLTLAMT